MKPGKEELTFLETTMLGDKSPFSKAGPSNLVDGLNRAFHSDSMLRQSIASFQSARTYAIQEFNSVRTQFAQKAPGYQLIDIESARSAGITPIGL